MHLCFALIFRQIRTIFHLLEDVPPVGLSPPVKNQIDFCQPSTDGPVAALTVYQTVIHYRDCASLTLVRGSHTLPGLF